MPTLAQLRCFAAIADDPNFRRTAQRLNMSQPPLTRQIQALEHELGIRLLDRHRRSVRLTPAGASFARSARAILVQVAEAAREARQIAQGDAGSVAIAFTATAGYATLPDLIGRIRDRFPNISLVLRELATPQQIEALKAGTVDVCLLRPPVVLQGICTRRLHRERLVVALPRGHALAARPELQLEDIGPQTLITYPPVEGPYLHGLVAGALHAAGVSPARVQYITQTHSILALVGAGLGVALVPETAGRFVPSTVVLRPIASRDAINVDLLLAWRAEITNPAGLAVLDVICPS